MTNWRVVYSDYSNKPSVLDTTSSPTTVYFRRNIEEVEVTDDMGDEPVTRKQWKYEERTCTQAEYSAAQVSAEIIELKHDDAVIDAYTLTLLEEGLI